MPTTRHGCLWAPVALGVCLLLASVVLGSGVGEIFELLLASSVDGRLGPMWHGKDSGVFLWFLVQAEAFCTDFVELRAVPWVLVILKQIFFSHVSRCGFSSRLQLDTHLFQASEPNMFLYNGVVLREPQF